MSEENKKDYRIILKEASKNHSSVDYLFGYILCLNTHKHIDTKEAMELIDYASDLWEKRKLVK